MQEKDEELVLRAQQGDTEAEEKLIERYKYLAKSKAKIYYIAGADREDVVQEGMIGLFKAIKTYDKTKSKFVTYAGICVNGQIINAIKKANRLKNKALNESISLDDQNATQKNKEAIASTLISEDTPEKQVLIKELMEYANSEKNNLFSDFEKKVWKEIQHGKSNGEIAKELNKSVKSIDNASQRIKKKLHSLLYD